MVTKNQDATISYAKTNKLSKFLRILGPSLITSALVLGPGSITLSSKIGAIYRSQFVWTLIIAVILMASYTEMAARIGAAGKDTFINLVKERWGKLSGVLIAN